MKNVTNRFGAFSVSLLFTLMIGSLPMAPTAYGITVNTGINEAGYWYRAGPGVVYNETNAPGEDIYIVRHQAPSLAQYRGDIPGLAATSPAATGAARLDAGSAASQAYLSYLAGLHSNLESAIEVRLGKNVDVVHRYDAVINGIAVRMSASDAQAVSTLSGIRSITRDYSRELQTDNGPHWIGADEIWGEGNGQLPSGNAHCVGNCGEGVVAGIIDTGVNFNHPSFADIGGDGYDHSNPRELAPGVPRFYGACDPTNVAQFIPGTICNDKLIGFYDFTGTGPEDDNGHGSHTASTTAGNVLNISLEAPTITIERNISGVAPHANIISYKGCSGTPVGCLISALIGAINAATLDGVDVINYSIGGASANPWADLDAQAFFDAYSAGIFVATSASNDGPGFGTLGSPADAPWVTSVGASTHDRKLANGIVNMTNADATFGIPDIFGASLTSASPQAVVVYAGDYAAESSDPANAHLCGSGVGDAATGEGSGGNPFPAGLFDGKIVVCDRGEYGRVHKSENVFEAGAVGYVLANDAANGDSLVGDAYPLPGVHISFDNGVILKQWIADNGDKNHQGTAMINGSNPSSAPEFADIMASFSSRGANPAAPSVIKPDVTAPGVDILAAWMASPEVTVQDIALEAAGVVTDANGETYGVISGTSMSSPHTAGSGALILGAHPNWTPDEVKSALMTTAFVAPPGNGPETHPVYKEDGATPADPFDMGAGRVDLHVAANAGFVLDETPANYDAANPGIGGDATTLNMASLGNDACEGTCTWTRTLKSTRSDSTTWTIDTSGDAGMTISASPSAFTLTGVGATQTVTFTADVSAVSPKGSWTFGEVRFTPNTSAPPAHFPVAVIPQAFGGPEPSTVLYFHGNQHDECADGVNPNYQGNGRADVLAGCDPFLSGDPLDTAPAATWGPLNPGLNGTTEDPHWVWNLSGDTRLAGPMVVQWWASQVTTTGPTGLFDTNFDITLTVDGVVWVGPERVAHTFLTPGVPQLLTSTINVPDITATSVVELKIDPVFIDTGNGITIYYDSEQTCNAASAGECDSRVAMPVRTGPLPPVANDDAVFMSSGDTVVVDVKANDFDPEGGPLAVRIVSGPANGTADVTINNAITYTHDGSAASSDIIEYEITDNDGLTARAFIRFTISAECTIPAGSYSDNFENGAEGWTVDTATLILPPPASNPWALTSPDLSAHSGSTVWFTDADAFDPAQEADVSKDVRLVSPAQFVSGNSELSFWHNFSMEDGFDGGVLEISTNGGSSWQDIVSAGGVFTQGGYNGLVGALGSRPGWTGISSTFLSLTMEEVQVDLSFFAGQTLQVRFRLAQDVLLGQPAGGWRIDDVAFSNLLESCTTQPPVARPDADTVTAGNSVTTDVKANDTDADTAHADLTVTQIVTAPQHGTAVIELNGDEVTYTHNGNTATSDFYEYRVEDTDGNFDTAIVTITIERPVNPPPVANDDSATVDAGQSVTIDVKNNDSDPNHANSELTVTMETAPTSGTAGVDGDGNIVYTHNGNAATSDSFQYRVTDPQGAFDIGTVSITINQPENAVPVAQDDTGTVDAGESVTIDVKNNDSDENHANSELTVTIVTAPGSGIADVNGDGTVTYTHSGDGATSDTFDYRLTDPEGASDVATVLITINQDGTGGTCRNDLCADEDSDKPAELTLTFVGGSCADSANTQGSKTECVDHVPGGASGTVMIRATNKDDDDADSAKVYYEGVVSEGGSFAISSANASEDDLGSKTFLHIYSADGSTLLQTIELHTSCSAPLIEGEQFGSLVLGDGDADQDDPICTTGEGRVHGSGYWDTDDDMDSDSDSDKIDFSFDAKVYKGGYKGKLKINDKYMDLKIDAKTITSLSTGNGQLCDGVTMDGVNTFLFTATGKFELGDDEVDDAEFRACGTDNGKNKEAPYDNFFVECTARCFIPYTTGAGNSNDIDGGNIHLHDAISDPVQSEGGSGAPAAAPPAEGGTSEPAAAGNSEPAAAGGTESATASNEPAAASQSETASANSEPAASDSEPAGSPDVVTLEPMLLTAAPAGTPMVVTAIAEMHGGAAEGTPVTLHWTTANGIKGQTTSLANAYGIVAFVVTVPAGDAVYSAKVGDLKSNSMRVNGF